MAEGALPFPVDLDLTSAREQRLEWGVRSGSGCGLRAALESRLPLLAASLSLSFPIW